jgi:hypothetical protein
MQIKFEKKWGAILFINIEYLHIVSIIYEFGVKKKSSKKTQIQKKHFSIPFKADSKPESSSIGWNSTRP